MKILVISAGPTVEEEFHKVNTKDFDLTIGINSACWRFGVDYAAFMDYQVIEGMLSREAKPREGIIWKHPSPRYWGESVRYEVYPKYIGGFECPTTLPNALNWAWSKYPDAEITLIGHSQAVGEKAIGGTGGCHDKARWSLENLFINQVQKEVDFRRNLMKFKFK
jgi:hypothetical protein